MFGGVARAGVASGGAGHRLPPRGSTVVRHGEGDRGDRRTTACGDDGVLRGVHGAHPAGQRRWHPGFFLPAPIAKWGATLDCVSGGRWAINVTSGWHLQEFPMYGVRGRRARRALRTFEGVHSMSCVARGAARGRARSLTIRVRFTRWRGSNWSRARSQRRSKCSRAGSRMQRGRWRLRTRTGCSCTGPAGESGRGLLRTCDGVRRLGAGR